MSTNNLTSRLNQDTRSHVLSYLRPQDIASCIVLNREWRHEVQRDQVLWRGLLEKCLFRLRVMPQVQAHEGEILKALYTRQCSILSNVAKGIYTFTSIGGGGVFSFYTTEDGTVFAGMDTGVIEIWKETIEGWKKCGEFPADNRGIISIHLTKEGVLLTGSVSGTVKIWECEKGEWRCKGTEIFEGFGDDFDAIMPLVAGEGTLCAMAALNRIKVWKRDEKREWKPQTVSALRTHIGPISSLQVTAEGVIYTACRSRQFKTWRYQEEEWRSIKNQRFAEHINCFTITQQGTRFFGLADGKIRVEEARSEGVIRNYILGKGNRAINALRVMDENTFFAGSSEGIVEIWRRSFNSDWGVFTWKGAATFRSVEGTAITHLHLGSGGTLFTREPGLGASIKMWDVTMSIEAVLFQMIQQLNEISPDHEETRLLLMERFLKVLPQEHRKMVYDALCKLNTSVVREKAEESFLDKDEFNKTRGIAVTNLQRAQAITMILNCIYWPARKVALEFAKTPNGNTELNKAKPEKAPNAFLLELFKKLPQEIIGGTLQELRRLQHPEISFNTALGKPEVEAFWSYQTTNIERAQALLSCLKRAERSATKEARKEEKEEKH